MISENTLQIDWIISASMKNRKADKILVEKVIRALLLLEGLAESGLDFIFKGGTALMLRQGSTRRIRQNDALPIVLKGEHKTHSRSANKLLQSTIAVLVVN